MFFILFFVLFDIYNFAINLKFEAFNVLSIVVPIYIELFSKQRFLVLKKAIFRLSITFADYNK